MEGGGNMFLDKIILKNEKTFPILDGWLVGWLEQALCTQKVDPT